MHDNAPPGASTIDVRRLLLLEHAAADLVATTETLESLHERILPVIGTALGWAVGGVWREDTSGPDAVLRCVQTWCADGEVERRPGIPVFIDISRRTTLPLGAGLPGRVWASGQTSWITDVRDDPNFPRTNGAATAGLAAALCFPVVSRDGIECVVELFATEPLAPAEELLTTAASLGRRIGDALRRNRIDDAVRQSEARLRAVLASALDCVVIADAHGTVLEFNPAACQTFGYSREEAVGRGLVDLIVPGDLRDAHRDGFGRYIRTEQAQILDRRVETTAMRADGSVFPAELSITRIGVPGPPVLAAYVRDLSVRHRAEEQLRASRRRVLEAVVRERQRLERNLHDGAQQRLISLGLMLARARTALPADPDHAAIMLDEAIAGLDDAAVELRNLARGIHPTTLTKYGLSAAIGDVVRRGPVEVTFGSQPDQRFPAAVEATAYFVVSEALTNVARYSGTGRAFIDIETEDGELVIVVADDGAGGASTERGTGLRGLADRVALLDGSFEVISPEGQGTTLVARIPLPLTATSPVRVMPAAG